MFLLLGRGKEGRTITKSARIERNRSKLQVLELVYTASVIRMSRERKSHIACTRNRRKSKLQKDLLSFERPKRKRILSRREVSKMEKTVRTYM